MTRLLQTFLDGLGNGSIYAALALALVMVHRATHVPNFAQGEFAMLCTYVAWDLQNRMGDWNPWLSWILALLAAISLGFVLGYLVQRGIIRWVDNASLLTKLIVTLGIASIVLSFAGWQWGYVPQSVDSPFGINPIFIGDAIFTRKGFGALMVLAVTLLIVYGIFNWTKLGLGLRGAAMNPASARLVGINVGRMLAIGWGMSLAIGATAGVMAAPVIGLEPTFLSTVILSGFTAAVVGGFESPPGAVVGGFIVGWIQSFSATYWPAVGNDLSLVVMLAVITAVLVFRPDGIFGKAQVQRV